MVAPRTYTTGQRLITSLAALFYLPIQAAGPEMAAVKFKGGTFICNGATPVTVADTDVIAGSNILISLNTVGGTVGAIPAVKTITPGTGFTVAGTASDTSTYNYLFIG